MYSKVLKSSMDSYGAPRTKAKPFKQPAMKVIPDKAPNKRLSRAGQMATAMGGS